MLLPSPFRTTVNFDLSVSIGPTSISQYKWMLLGTPSVCTLCSCIVICLPVLSHGSLKDHLSDHNAGGSQGEVSGDGLESSQQSGYLEAIQALHEGDLHGRTGTWGETICPDTCGRRWWSLQLLGHSWRHHRERQRSKPGMGCIREKLQRINFILAFQISGRTPQNQWLTWISTSNRPSGDANWRRGLRRSKWLTCCTMPQSTTGFVSTFKSQNLPHSSTRWSLKRQMPTNVMSQSTKTIKFLVEELTAHLLTITRC